MEILSECGKSTVRYFRLSCMNHGKESIVGQLIPVEHDRLTVSETVSIDDPAGYTRRWWSTETRVEDSKLR